MRGGIFVDTSAWYALADNSDANHGRAAEFSPRAVVEYQEIISNNHVIGETYTLIGYQLSAISHKPLAGSFQAIQGWGPRSWFLVPRS
ncbi:MAG: hypothetical protein Q8O86_09750 [Dehalococcoidia bacterium]|nr:hypothetical protein [Dehalococcoidia bacterium]